jgi:hypothetical protein
MVDQHPFLLETLTQVDKNTFPFQQHLKVTCDLLPPPTRVCLLPFKQLIGQQVVHFQDYILKCLHLHTLSRMFFNGTFEAHRVQILSCSGPKASIWFIVRPVFPTFRLFSPIFCSALHMQLGLPHPSIVSILRCVCTHPIDPIGIHFLRCAHGNKCIGTHDAIHDTFAPLHEMLVSTWDENNYMHFLQPHSIPFINESTLCLPKMAFAP